MQEGQLQSALVSFSQEKKWNRITQGLQQLSQGLQQLSQGL